VSCSVDKIDDATHQHNHQHSKKVQWIMDAELREERCNRKTFALVVRGQSNDFVRLVEQARVSGLYVVYTKTSNAKIVVQEVPW
jgi:hypothetical protein